MAFALAVIGGTVLFLLVLQSAPDVYPRNEHTLVQCERVDCGEELIDNCIQAEIVLKSSRSLTSIMILGGGPDTCVISVHTVLGGDDDPIRHAYNCNVPIQNLAMWTSWKKESDDVVSDISSYCKENT